MLNPRRYLASPRAPGASRLELDGFPYAERGYTMGSQAARLYLPDRLRNKGQLTAPSDQRHERNSFDGAP